MEGKTLLLKLKDRDDHIFSLLYDRYFHSIKNYIIHNSGNIEDAEDVFQECMLLLLEKATTDKLLPESNIHSYIFICARNIWLKKMRDKKHFLTDEQISIDEFESDFIQFELTTQPSLEEQIKSWIAKISGNCQNILRAIYLYEQSMDTLMKKMGWKNRHTANNQKYKCLQQLKKAVLKNYQTAS